MSVGLALFFCRGLQKSSAIWKQRSATFHGVDDFMVGNVSSGLQLKKAQALLAALILKKKKKAVSVAFSADGILFILTHL